MLRRGWVQRHLRSYKHERHPRRRKSRRGYPMAVAFRNYNSIGGGHRYPVECCGMPTKRGAAHDYRKDALASQKRLRVGVAARFDADEEVTTTFKVAVEVVRSLGHEILAADAPLEMPPFGDMHAIEADRQAVADRAFQEIDVLLLPTMTTTVPRVDQASANPQSLSAANTMFANYFGLPAISLPCGFDLRGLPIGLQMVAKPWHDGEILQLAHQYQVTTNGHNRHRQHTVWNERQRRGFVRPRAHTNSWVRVPTGGGADPS